MALFNKILARIGIGAARVDAKLVNDEFRAGEKIEGIVEVYGGNVEQTIDRIYLRLFTSYVKEVDDKKVKQDIQLNVFKINEPFTIQPAEKKKSLLLSNYLMIHPLRLEKHEYGWQQV